jgi:hypothetical protein
MTSMTSYEYPRIDDARKSYYICLGQDEIARELVRELVAPRVRGYALPTVALNRMAKASRPESWRPL